MKPTQEVPRRCGAIPLPGRALNNTDSRAEPLEAHYLLFRRARRARNAHPPEAVEQPLDTAAISRGQNQLHVLPEDGRSAAGVIQPLLARLSPHTVAPQLLVVTNDAEAAAEVSALLAPAAAERGLRTLAATSAGRAMRVLRSTPAHVVIASPVTLVELQRSATLKLDTVTIAVLAWIDDVSAGATRALEALMVELPKDAARIIIASDATPAVEQLVERYARRPRRVQPAGVSDATHVSVSFVTTSDAGRPAALRRVLDALDPGTAVVVAESDNARAKVEHQLRSLGYAADGAARVAQAADALTQLVVLYEAPSSGAALRAAIGGNTIARIVALVTPRQVSALRRLAGGSTSPLTLPESVMRARSREDAVRDELRKVLSAGQYARELVSLEPLLNDYDGAEIAAAAVRLLEAERSKPASAPPVTAAPQPPTRPFDGPRRDRDDRGERRDGPPRPRRDTRTGGPGRDKRDTRKR